MKILAPMLFSMTLKFLGGKNSDQGSTGSSESYRSLRLLACSDPKELKTVSDLNKI